ncbi:MAG: proteasome-type protease [Betaproteobacteria bacterium]|nr:proteasome-type protease [Pseudomonadota bacterium]
MTYCVGIILDSGLVFASDSRTNAGIDQVSTFRKMRIVERPGDRVIVVMSSGNLSVTQSAINLMEQKARKNDGSVNLFNAQSMFEIAGLLGDCLREVRERDAPYLAQHNIDSSASFIIGGQVAGDIPRLYLIYSEGNYIEATQETPFFQIGETKYGKPIIDRVIKPSSNLVEASKCVLVSFDSTMRSNVSVGLPIDLVNYENNSLKIGLQRRITENDAYFSMIHTQWGEGLRRVFAQLPDPYWDESTAAPALQQQHGQIFK